MAHLRKLKRINIEKTSLQKKELLIKKKNLELRAALDENIPAYTALQQEYEVRRKEGLDTELLQSQMSELLARIESDRKKYDERKAEVHRVRQKLRELEEQTTTERAELVTTAGILDEDNKLRQRIQEEERDKARAAIQAELSEARAKLEKERDEARGTIEADFKQQLTEARAQALEYRTQAIEFKGKYKQSEMERLRLEQQISELAQKNGELEDRLVEAEEAIAVTQQEAEALATDKANVQRSLEDALEAAKVKEVEYHRRLEANQRQHSAQLEAMVTDSRRSAEDREFQVFRALMDTFQVERKELADKLESMRRLLSQATQVRGREVGVRIQRGGGGGRKEGVKCTGRPYIEI